MDLVGSSLLFTILATKYWGNREPLSCLTLFWRTSRSYRNQSIDLQSKSMNWFPYDRTGPPSWKSSAYNRKYFKREIEAGENDQLEELSNASNGFCHKDNKGKNNEIQWNDDINKQQWKTVAKHKPRFTFHRIKNVSRKIGRSVNN